MHIITRLIVGGSQELVLLTCREQLRRGHDVTLVYGRTDGAEGSMVDQAQAVDGLALREMPSMWPDVAIDDWRAYQDVAAVVSRHAPDVVHTHTFKAGVLGRYAADRLGVRCVMHTVHGARFHDGQSRWRNGVIIAGERLAAKRCHRMLSVSAALRDRFIAAGIGRPSQYRVVYSGLELERYADAEAARIENRRVFGFEDDDFVIGTVGRLAPMKGHDDLLNALSEDLRRDPRVKLLWVGGGPERERLRAAIAARGLAAQVVMTGHQPSDRVPSLVAAMDAMAHPSYREGFPLAILHAMLCGVPAIAYDVDGPGEMLVDNESGFLLRVGDESGLRRTALALLADPERRRRVGRRARETATARYGHVRMVSDIEAHYEEVLHG